MCYNEEMWRSSVNESRETIEGEILRKQRDHASFIFFKKEMCKINNFKEVFGNKITNALFRMGITSREELWAYFDRYPFEHNTKCYIWRGIGPVSYKKIRDYLQPNEIGLDG